MFHYVNPFVVSQKNKIKQSLPFLHYTIVPLIKKNFNNFKLFSTNFFSKEISFTFLPYYYNENNQNNFQKTIDKVFWVCYYNENQVNWSIGKVV